MEAVSRSSTATQGRAAGLIPSSFIPLGLVFLSGLGFSLQSLVIKLLEQDHFAGTFQLIFCRGSVQLVVASARVYIHHRQGSSENQKLCGNTMSVSYMLVARAVIGFLGTAFSFLAVEKLPMGDATTLSMLSQVFSPVLAIFILSEPWHLLGNLHCSFIDYIALC
jgi:drug/metabolite transporter (DMT)-like permease